MFRKKTFLYAQGIGPLTNRLLRWLTATILGRMSALTFRDEESKDFIHRLGVKHSLLKTTADPVFSLGLPSPPEKFVEKKHFGFVFRKITPQEQKIWAETIGQIQQKLDVETILIPFQQSEDYPIAEKIIQLMKTKVKLFQWTNLNQLIGIFASLDLVIAMRLHALILGLLNEKVVIGIGDEPKIVSLLDAFGLPVISHKIFSPEYLSNSIVHLWQEQEKYQSSIREKIPFYREKAKRTAELALQLI